MQPDCEELRERYFHSFFLPLLLLLLFLHRHHLLLFLLHYLLLLCRISLISTFLQCPSPRGYHEVMKDHPSRWCGWKPEGKQKQKFPQRLHCYLASLCLLSHSPFRYRFLFHSPHSQRRLLHSPFQQAGGSAWCISPSRRETVTTCCEALTPHQGSLACVYFEVV